MIFIVLLKSVFSYDWLNWLNKLDTFIFFKINTVYTSSFFDTLFPWYREGNTWIPLYLFLILFVSLFPILRFLLLLHDLIDYLLLPLSAQLHVSAVPLYMIVRVCVLGEYLCDDQLGQLVILD